MKTKTQKPSMKGAWVQALKVWNKQKGDGKWLVPKKGTKDYDEVKAIMEKGMVEGGFIGPLIAGLASAVLPGLLR